MRYSSAASRTRWRFSPTSSASRAQDQKTILASPPTSSTSSVAGLKMISSTPMAANKSTNASTSSTDPQTAWGGHVRGRLARPDVKWRMLARPPSGSPQREVRDRDEPRQPLATGLWCSLMSPCSAPPAGEAERHGRSRQRYLCEASMARPGRRSQRARPRRTASGRRSNSWGVCTSEILIGNAPADLAA